MEIFTSHISPGELWKKVPWERPCAKGFGWTARLGRRIQARSAKNTVFFSEKRSIPKSHSMETWNGQLYCVSWHFKYKSSLSLQILSLNQFLTDFHCTSSLKHAETNASGSIWPGIRFAIFLLNLKLRLARSTGEVKLHLFLLFPNLLSSSYIIDQN